MTDNKTDNMTDNVTTIASSFVTIDTPVGPVRIAASGGRIREIHLDAKDEGDGAAAAGERADRALTRRAAEQLEAYFAGRLTTFDLPLGAEGTDFQRSVWHELSRIPYGTIASYGEIARRVGRPTGSRAVGAANGRNPIAIVVPCHRVIGANGTLTGYAGGLWRKEWLLAHEGVEAVGGVRAVGGAS